MAYSVLRYIAEPLEQLLERRALSLIYGPDFFLPYREAPSQAAIANVQALITRSSDPLAIRTYGRLLSRSPRTLRNRRLSAPPY